ncbi:MAG: hypothetical protein FWE69_05875 [Clostridiales bacterium]|nr:hypothetical protein [Clostridiales bacterium]
MPQLDVKDFYFGAVLSKLFETRKEVNLFLVQSPEKTSRVYKIMADYADDFSIFAKYRTKRATSSNDYESWAFKLTKNELAIINEYLSKKEKLSLALVCGVSASNKSHLCILYENDIKKILDVGISFTIGREKNKQKYRILSGWKELMKISTSRLY